MVKFYINTCKFMQRKPSFAQAIVPIRVSLNQTAIKSLILANM